jgi:GT2 family glycosyltransferase
MARSRPPARNGSDGIPVQRGRTVPEAPEVSVCIPVVSDHALVGDCLESIAESHPSVETEVVVVANGLGDEALAGLRRRDDIVLVHSLVNAGFSGGNNLAARWARGRYLLLLNDDSVIEAGFVDRLISAVRREPSIAAAGGTILSADGSIQEAGSVLWSDGWAAHVGAGHAAGSSPYHYVRDTDYISANGLLVERGAWDAVGGLDERYFPAYYEDVDLCLALRSHGYRVVYEPRARLRHLESRSTTASYRNFLLIRNRAQLVDKWSDLLQNLADHPDPIDDAAVDAAVLRAQRSRGRVLVIEESAEAVQWRVPTLEGLVAAGWSAMVSAPSGRAAAGRDDQDIRERLVDLGVDVREQRPEGLLAAYGQTIEAVVVEAEGPDSDSTPRRPDGSPIPVVHQPRDGEDPVADRLAALARPAEETPTRVAPRAAGHPRAVAGPSEGEVTVDLWRRNLEFAEADARVRREYAESLEREVAHLRAVAAETDAAFARLVEAFDEKERYIESLPSVRAKKWITDRIRWQGP